MSGGVQACVWAALGSARWLRRRRNGVREPWCTNMRMCLPVESAEHEPNRDTGSPPKSLSIGKTRDCESRCGLHVSEWSQYTKVLDGCAVVGEGSHTGRHHHITRTSDKRTSSGLKVEDRKPVSMYALRSIFPVSICISWPLPCREWGITN